MKQFPMIKRQIVASPRGVSQIFPGYKWRTVPTDQPTVCKMGDVPSDCPGFDPRTRAWFMGTASTSKSVIINLDVSASMGYNHRIENAIYATRTVINNLTDRDYVGVVIFSSEAFLCKKQTKALLKATPENKKLLIECIDNITPFGPTNFEIAFNLTFNLFKQSMNVDRTCERVILLLTDGTFSRGSNPIPLIQARNAELGAKQAKIFTFSLGTSVGSEIARQIACENRGLWSVIPDRRIQDLNSQMSSYYEYLSARYEERNATWSTPFNDVTGLGELATVSISCSTREGKFLGVALAAISSSTVKNSTEYLRRTQQFKCPTDIPLEYLQRLRIEEGKTCNYCGYCLENDAPIILIGSIGGTVGMVVLVLGLVWLIRKLYLRRRKWKMRKDKISSERKSSFSWINLSSQKRKLEKVRLPTKLAGEEVELNQEYTSFNKVVV